MSRVSDITSALTSLSLKSHPSSSTELLLSDPSACIFPSHVRASYRRNPTDRTGELVRLLDDISLVTHAISSYAARCAKLLDAQVATKRLYTSLCHDGYACMILEKSHEAPLTFADSALQGGYVVMITALDMDPDASEHVLCGTMFSVYKRRTATSLPGRLKDLQQDLGHQVAAGFVLYASATTLYYTMGDGVYSFILQPVARQYFVQPSLPLKLAQDKYDLYVNYPCAKIDKQVGQKVVELCKQEKGTIFDNGCFTANVAGAMKNGGIIFATDVHLLCEAGPMAFVVEQLGGKATDGMGQRILSMSIDDEDVHKTVRFLAGSSTLVDRIQAQSICKEADE